MSGRVRVTRVPSVKSSSRSSLSSSRGNKSGRSNASSSSDDMKSFCDTLSGLFSRSSGSKTSKTKSSDSSTILAPPITTAPHRPPEGNDIYRSNLGLRATYEEPANVHNVIDSIARFDCRQDVQEITVFGSNQSYAKNAQRGSKNPWRRYGALRKLHEIGGLTTEKPPKGLKKKKGKKGDTQEYQAVKKCSKAPDAPNTAELTINRDRTMDYMNRFRVVKGVAAEEVSQTLALEMQHLANMEWQRLENAATKSDSSKSLDLPVAEKTDCPK